MKRLVTKTVLTILLISGATVVKVSAIESGKWRGYLVDRQCAESVNQDVDPKMFIQHHTKDCALMPNCRATGYTIYTAYAKEHEWFYLDKKGNELAVKLLKASKRRSGFYVEVTGAQQGKSLKTQMIKEINEPKAQ